MHLVFCFFLFLSFFRSFSLSFFLWIICLLSQVIDQFVATKTNLIPSVSCLVAVASHQLLI